MKCFAICSWVLLLVVASNSAYTDEDPQVWLDRMSTAMSQMSYQGTFIYISGGRMETMRITHVADENGARERLASVSGPEREVVRDATGVRWMSGEDESVVSDPATNWPMFLDQSFRGLSAKSDVYRLKLLDRKRIAEFTGQQLDIVATDDFRYGYSVWLEAESGLLLQWQLNDKHGNSLAKLVFTELKIGTEVNQSELRASHKKTDKAKTGLLVDTAVSASIPRHWSPGWLPPGFHMMASRAPQTGEKNGFQHQVYSDGIASISLYLEPDDGAADSGLGLRQLGTSHIFGRKGNGVMVTVVGDVPAITVEKIAQSVDFSQ